MIGIETFRPRAGLVGQTINTPLQPAPGAPSRMLHHNDTSENLSPLSRQLSEALQRANERDTNMTRDQLKARAAQALNEIFPPGYHKSDGKSDHQVPDTTDPAILARARQATAYENGQAANPFKGLSPELLTAVIYDDSATFTLNERRAARAEAWEQEQAWRIKVIAESNLEYSLTRRITRLHGQLLDHYRAQPPIEQAQMPDDYEKQLVDRISTILSTPDQWHDLSLYDVLRRWQSASMPQQNLFSIIGDEARPAANDDPLPAIPSIPLARTASRPGSVLPASIALHKAVVPRNLPGLPQT